MKIIPLVLASLAAFVAGELTVAGAILTAGVALLPSSMSFGGAFDPITATLAIGAGGLAIRQLRARSTPTAA